MIISDETSFKNFINNFASDSQTLWNRQPFDADEFTLGSVKSPIDSFYELGIKICRGEELAPTFVPGTKTNPSAGPEEERLMWDFLSDLNSAVNKEEEPPQDEQIRSMAKDIAENVEKYKEQQVITRLLLHLDREKPLEALSFLARSKATAGALEPFLSGLAETYLRPVRTKATPEATAALIEEIRRHLDEKKEDGKKKDEKKRDEKKKASWCSLIYCYWLDEGGLPWSLERIADRIENGIVRTTRPLHSVHVEEGSAVSQAIGMFTSIWQRGELAAVDARRRQYHALYGFPLHIANKWGPINTVDPRHNFPAAFHRFLAEAMQFYKESRNRQIDPDTQAAASALGTLAVALREGNENLRVTRPPEFRAQFEYTKRLLGGFKPADQIGEDWSKALPGRPGVRNALEPWEFAVDTVSGLYGWSRPRMKTYLTLAEQGETILVMVRLFSDVLGGASGDLGSLGESSALAVLDLLKNPIQKYVYAYKTVSRVDLSMSEPKLGAPAKVMAAHIKPPFVPPLRRSWATEVPLSA